MIKKHAHITGFHNLMGAKLQEYNIVYESERKKYLPDFLLNKTKLFFKIVTTISNFFHQTADWLPLTLTYMDE